ncbi:MAG: DUF488 family protein, N3 subclade [Geminicoccaceae bacterium]
MLKQASLAQIRKKELPRGGSHIVVTMRFYPRFLKKELRDEFIADLAPDRDLLKAFNDAQKRLGDHNSAFAEVDYNRRFELCQSAWQHLERLSDLSRSKDVYLACICAMGERCHREILLLVSKHFYGCQIGDVFHDYPEFMERYQ